MDQVHLISAAATPLEHDQSLCVEGLSAQLDRQINAGIDGLLIGGSMGAMQMLADATYAQLIRHSVEQVRGRVEVLAGVGDTSLARTRDRIRLVEQYAVDGLVILSPYLWSMSQRELQKYFLALADTAIKPVYLYDLPVLTGKKIELQTVLRLAEHPNILGIKCSDRYEWTRELIDAVASAGIKDSFRIIAAAPGLMDQLLRVGVTEHVDGIFVLAPAWAVGVAKAAQRGDWSTATACQRKLSEMLVVIRRQPSVFAAFTTLLNALGIPGNVAPAPLRPQSATERAALLAEPIVQQLLTEADETISPQSVDPAAVAVLARGAEL